jgi:hypothetical protein
MPPRSNPRPRNNLLQSFLHFMDSVFLERSFAMAPNRSKARILTPSFRTEQADFFLRFRSCESFGLRM